MPWIFLTQSQLEAEDKESHAELKEQKILIICFLSCTLPSKGRVLDILKCKEVCFAGAKSNDHPYAPKKYWISKGCL